MTPRARYAFLALFVALLAGDLLMHRWPRHHAAADLDAIRQRVAALERELDAARAADRLLVTTRVASASNAAESTFASVAEWGARHGWRVCCADSARTVG
jgi:hypothetical protein